MEHGKLMEGIHKPVQSCAVMEIRWKLHCQVVATHNPLGILIAGEAEEREELKNLLMSGKFSFYLMVDRVQFRYLKNKKQLT